MRTLLLVVLVLWLAGCRQPEGDASPSSNDVYRRAAATAPEAREAVQVAPQQAVHAEAGEPARIVLSPEGLALAGRNGAVRVMPFGEPADAVIAAVSALRAAAPERMRNEECGAGPLDMAHWPDSLTVISQDSRFVGWSLNARGVESAAAPATAAGIGIGSTRTELLAAHPTTVHESTLGEEFEAGGIFGVLDGTAPGSRIEALWGGTSCNFR